MMDKTYTDQAVELLSCGIADILEETHPITVEVLIEGDRTADAQALRLADPEWRSEPFLLVEFSHLLATQVRAKARRPMARISAATASTSASVRAAHTTSAPASA